MIYKVLKVPVGCKGAQLANTIGAAAEEVSASFSALSVGNQAQAIMDVWRGVVMPLALVRAEYEH